MGPSQFSLGHTAQSLTCSIMEKPHTGLDDWECYCHDLAKGCLQPACCMSACLSVEMGKKRQFIFVRRHARRPTMSPGMTYCSRPLFALPRVDWFSRYRPPRLQWYWLQWHSKEIIAYSDPFSNSWLTFHKQAWDLWGWVWCFFPSKVAFLSSL